MLTDTIMHFHARDVIGLQCCRPDVKAEEDADTHSRSGSQRSRKQRSATPELRLTRSKHHSQDLPAELRQTGRSLPVKMDQSAVSGDKAAINQGSSGSPGKGTGSSSQQGLHKRHSSKVAVGDGGGVVKAEVTSSRLRHGTGGASTSGESHSHVDLAVACPDQADAVEGSGGLRCTVSCSCCCLLHCRWLSALYNGVSIHTGVFAKCVSLATFEMCI